VEYEFNANNFLNEGQKKLEFFKSNNLISLFSFFAFRIKKILSEKMIVPESKFA
jgi:hypothetical protein